MNAMLAMAAMESAAYRAKYSRSAASEPVKPDMASVPCNECNELFLQKAKNQNYCSRKCKNKYFNRKAAAKRPKPPVRPAIDCGRCNTSFVPRNSRSKFCSEVCSDSHAKDYGEDYRVKHSTSTIPISKDCTVCGAGFKPITKNNNTCSRDCADKRRQEMQLAYRLRVKAEEFAFKSRRAAA